MELPVLDKFCFVFDLKSGCITMGTLNAIFTFILAMVLITFAIDMKEVSDATSLLKKAGERDDVTMSSVVYTIAILLIVLLLIKFFLDMIFVYAVYKERRSLMKKYCIFWIIFVVLFIIGFLKSLFHMDASHVIAHIIFLAENFYYIVIIRSYLISINEEGVL